MGRGFFDRHGQPAWRRNEAERARQQREAHDAARRQRLGLAPVEPARGSGVAYDTATGGTITFAGTGWQPNDQITYRYQWTNSNSATTLTDDELALRRVAPGDTREYEERAVPVPAEREPTLREIWRD